MAILYNVRLVNERISNAQLRRGNTRQVKIVAITKTHSANTIIDAYDAGLRTIGENRIQEAENKFKEIPEALLKIEKRFVGHLQSNKINKALNLFDTIDTVDSIQLAKKIGQKAFQLNKVIPILLEVNTSGESSKFGFDPNAIDDLLACAEMPGIELQGLMTIGPHTVDINKIRTAFIKLRELFESMEKELAGKVNYFKELSMGMSGDFEIAVEEGATMVRLGTALFGPRRKS